MSPSTLNINYSSILLYLSKEELFRLHNNFWDFISLVRFQIENIMLISSKTIYFPTLRHIREASEVLDGVAEVTPLVQNFKYSKEFASYVYFKREDLQPEQIEVR